MTAREAALEVQEGDPVPWRDLQAEAFAEHPGVLTALDPTSRPPAIVARVQGIAVVAGILLILALIVAPVVAFVIVAVDGLSARPAPQVTIPAASIIFLLTLPLLIGVFFSWYRSDRSRESLRERQVSLLAGFGLLSLAVALTRSSLQDYPDGVRWSAGIAVPALFAVVFWVALLRDARRLQERYGADSPEAGLDPVNRGTEPLQHVRIAVEKLSDADRAAVRADLDAAIDELVQRGIIDGGSGAWARDAPLGKLPMHMSQHTSQE